MSRTQANQGGATRPHLGATRPRVGSKYLQLLLPLKVFDRYNLGLNSKRGIQP